MRFHNLLPTGETSWLAVVHNMHAQHFPLLWLAVPKPPSFVGTLYVSFETLLSGFQVLLATDQQLLVHETSALAQLVVIISLHLEAQPVTHTQSTKLPLIAQLVFLLTKTRDSLAWSHPGYVVERCSFPKAGFRPVGTARLVQLDNLMR